MGKTRPIGTLELHHNWTDFAYGTYVASAMGIIRVSDGSRFNADLLPTQTHRTATVPGRKGTYYFGSDSTQQNITIQFAFDGLNDRNLRELTQWIRASGISVLAFDNGDCYKDVKITSSSIKFLPFEATTEEKEKAIANGTRAQDANTIYKGEGTIQFTCYDPTKYVWRLKDDGTDEGIWSLDDLVLVDINDWIIIPADEPQGI